MVLHHMSEGRSGFALQYGALHPGGPPYLRGHPLGPHHVLGVGGFDTPTVTAIAAAEHTD